METHTRHESEAMMLALGPRLGHEVKGVCNRYYK